MLRRQGHRARETADGRIIIDPTPKPKHTLGEASLGRLLAKMRIVTPLMKALEVQAYLQRLIYMRLGLLMRK